MIFPKVSNIDLVGCIPHSISTISSGFLLCCASCRRLRSFGSSVSSKQPAPVSTMVVQKKKYARFDELGFWFPQEKQNIKSPSHRALYFESQSYFEAKFLDSSVPMVKFTRSSWFKHSVHNSFIFHDYSALKMNKTIWNIHNFPSFPTWRDAVEVYNLGITMGITV